MKSKGVLLAAFACIALAGCGGHSLWRGKNPSAARMCNVADCPPIEVKVVEDSSSGRCWIEPVPDLNVALGPRTQRIRWELVTENYEFSRVEYRYGIYIPEPPLGVIQNVTIPGNGRTITLMFTKDGTGKDYKYDLNVRRSGGDKPFCRVLDPWLIS